MELGLSGLASGFDWRSLIDQLSEVERAPQRRMVTEQGRLEQRNTAYGALVTQLNVLKNKVKDLNDTSLYASRTTSVGDEEVATATAATNSAIGTHTFNITQLATASAQVGSSDAGHRLSDTNDVSALTLSAAKFASSFTAGTITVNNKKVTIASTDTLQGVFDKIQTATGVVGTYDSTNDTITLSHGSAIVLGSATDTSNFFQLTKLYNNGTGTVTSAGKLGTVQLNSKLNAANFNTAVTDGGSGAGSFKVNGVSIAYDASTDTVADILARINNSSTGVSAGYDAVNDRVILTNKTTGDMGIALEDVTGNFLAASGLSGGTLSRGKNLLYTLDGGGQLVSTSNTITDTSSGVTGVSITALTTGETTVEIKSDTEKVKTAINAFIAAYNDAQDMIDKETSSSTNEEGKVTAGILASQTEANELATKLRRHVNAILSDLSGSITSLSDLGIKSNGTDDKITLSDTEALDDALSNHLEDVKDLFTNEDIGLTVELEAYLERTAGDEGSLLTLQDNLTEQISDIDEQIVSLEKLVQANEDRLTLAFVAMETAQAKINQQMQFLNQKLGIS